MFSILISLIILFFVIIDPLTSFVVFFVSTKGFDKKTKMKIAILSVLLATIISYLVLFLGNNLLQIFSTDINSFKIAGGIILVILGINMSLGKSFNDIEKMEGDSVHAVASIIATPLISGPATITAIIISSSDFGKLLTGAAIGIILIIIAILFYLSIRYHNITNKAKTTIQVVTTIMGLITLAWGVNYVLSGIQVVFNLI
ncbi:MAG: MarC family protein [Candidatus ainarchaeum sp.]|nr:MarC family protein [Candidatus ainarchaeum sp.]